MSDLRANTTLASEILHHKNVHFVLVFEQGTYLSDKGVSLVERGLYCAEGGLGLVGNTEG